MQDLSSTCWLAAFLCYPKILFPLKILLQSAAHPSDPDRDGAMPQTYIPAQISSASSLSVACPPAGSSSCPQRAWRVMPGLGRAGPEVEQKKGRGEALEGPLLAFFGVFLGWAFRTLVRRRHHTAFHVAFTFRDSLALRAIHPGETEHSNISLLATAIDSCQAGTSCTRRHSFRVRGTTFRTHVCKVGNEQGDSA